LGYQPKLLILLKQIILILLTIAKIQKNKIQRGNLSGKIQTTLISSNDMGKVCKTRRAFFNFTKLIGF